MILPVALDVVVSCIGGIAHTRIVVMILVLEDTPVDDLALLRRLSQCDARLVNFDANVAVNWTAVAEPAIPCPHVQYSIKPSAVLASNIPKQCNDPFRRRYL
jgi:hypothetical protein